MTIDNKVKEVNCIMRPEHMANLGYREHHFGYGLIWSSDKNAYLSTEKNEGYVRLYTKINYK